MRTRPVIALGAAAALTLLGAGAAGASTSASAKPPVKLHGKVTNKGIGKVSGGEAEVEADDFYFSKTFIKGKPGSKVTVTIKNEGNATHTFTIDAQNVDKTIDAGKSVQVKVKIPANGKPANFYCRFHVGSGMQGAFFSAAGRRAPGGGSSSGSGGYGY